MVESVTYNFWCVHFTVLPHNTYTIVCKCQCICITFRLVCTVFAVKSTTNSCKSQIHPPIQWHFAFLFIPSQGIRYDGMLVSQSIISFTSVNRNPNGLEFPFQMDTKKTHFVLIFYLLFMLKYHFIYSPPHYFKRKIENYNLFRLLLFTNYTFSMWNPEWQKQHRKV